MLREEINQLNKLPQKIMLNATQTDCKNAIVAVIVENNELSITNESNQTLAKCVCDGIRSQMATPKVINIPVIDANFLTDSAGSRYDLPQRDFTAQSVELLLSTQCYDGVVFIASQQNVAVGMLLASIRTNTPCAFVFGGVMTPIEKDNRKYGYIEYGRQVAKIKNGELTNEEVLAVDNLPATLGNDCERYSQNSIACVFETLGLTLKGMASATAMSTKLKSLAYQTGQLATSIIKNKLIPSRIITQEAIVDAIVTDLAIEGSSTTMLNLLALAKTLSLKQITLDTIGDLAKTTPVLLEKPSDLPIMCALEQSGGVYSVMKMLLEAKLIKLTHTGIENIKLNKAVQQHTVPSQSYVKQANDKSIKQSANLRVLYGNVAEEGCFCHYHNNGNFKGVAKVYDKTESVIDALMLREIKPNDVIVIKNEGAKSCPGMREVILPFALLEGLNLSQCVAVITDGRIPDFYQGIAVGHITPESADNALFAVIQDGDDIEISVSKGKITCDIPAREVQTRIRNLDILADSFANKYLRNWGKSVSSASEGCVTK